jgi:signal transduction histidine kinase
LTPARWPESACRGAEAAAGGFEFLPGQLNNPTVPWRSTVNRRFRLLAAVCVVVAAALAGAAGRLVAQGTMSPWALALAAGGAVAAFFLAGAFHVRRHWIGPAQRLALATERMGGGEWEVRVDPRGNEMFQMLALRLNALAAQVQSQFAELNKTRSDLQRLVDSLPDPILATDGSHRIIMANAPAAVLLQLAPAQAMRQKIVAIINDEPILELVDQLGADSAPRPLQREIRIVRRGQRYAYQVVAQKTADGGALLVFRDQSTLAATGQMKTDFVANASHELRTPIAAIKVAFETLREVMGDDKQQSERCLTIIDGHLRRLEDMLRDLMDLSRVESPSLRMQVAPVKVSDLYSLLRSTLVPLARQKNVDVRLLDHTPPEQFQSDSWLLNVILKNLVENSIRFTPPAGTVTVEIGFNSGNGPGVFLSVADTGIGIAREHIDRVFERFYQVDPSRSGSAGRGTGLGLAIVKHAVNALGGTVKLESTLGKGTTVTCLFPAAAASTAA